MFSLNKNVSRLLRPGLWINLAILVLCTVAALFFEQYYLAIAEAGGALILLLYAAINSRSRKRQIMRYIQTTVNAMDAALRSEAPMPKLLLDLETEEVIWAI